MLGSGIAMWQICCRIVVSSSVGGARSRCPCSGVWLLLTLGREIGLRLKAYRTFCVHASSTTRFRQIVATDDDTILILMYMTMLMVLSPWHSHCESSPVPVINAEQPRWPPTFESSQSAWAAGPPIGSYSVYIHRRHLIATELESWYSFYRPVEGKRLNRPGWVVTYSEMAYLPADSHPSKY